MAQRVKIEICCGSADDVIQAAHAGADRVELNSALFLGGLTPSVGELRAAKAHSDIPVMAMLRPREGGFCYTQAEFETMLYDAQAALNAGADGIVFGCLNPDGTVDKDRCARMVEAADGRQTVFHRAIDVVPDWRAALETLIELGVTRVLTSGQRESALLGAPVIREMIAAAGDRIEILPGAGIKPGNVEAFVRDTGCGQIHMTGHKICYDTSVSSAGEIFFGGCLYPREDRYKMVDGSIVSSVRSILS